MPKLILDLSIIILIVFVAIVFWKTLVSKSLPLYSFLFIFTVGSLVFVAPQIKIVYSTVPVAILSPTIAYIALCYVMFYFGCMIKIEVPPLNNPIRSIFKKDSLALYAIGFILISTIGFIKLTNSETSANSQWSGKDVMYNFFFTAYRYALIFASVGYFKTRKRIYLVLILISSLFFVDRILISGRRTDLVYYAIAIGVPYLYYTQVRPKLILLCTLLVLSFQLLSLLVAVRTVTLEGSGFGSFLSGNRLPSIEAVMLAKQKIEIKDKGRAPELTACCYGINAVINSGNFDYGGGYWNAVVQDFLPSQLVGAEFKQSLKFAPIKLDLLGYRVFTGSTMTGFFDSFQAFGYVGCIFFFIMGYFMTMVCRKAFQGDTFCMIFYLCIIVDALHAVTHRSSLFLSGMIYFCIYIFIMHFFINIMKTNRYLSTFIDKEL